MGLRKLECESCGAPIDMNPELAGPVLVARLKPTTRVQLCGDMGGAMKGMGMK